MESLSELLEPFGATPESIIEMGTGRAPEPRHLPYLDLMAPNTQAQVSGVVERAGRAAVYVVRGSRSDEDRKRLSAFLEQRDAADYLAEVTSGVLTVYELAGAGEGRPERLRATRRDEPGARATLATLLEPQQVTDGERPPKQGERFRDRLLKLLLDTTRGLIGARIKPEDALACVGRAGLFRFLIDRAIVQPQDARAIAGVASLERCFDTTRAAQRTSRWLDDTFNGDLLPLDDGFWQKPAAERATSVLGDILHKAEAGQLSFDWHSLDFAHIPVGLLSQVYEAYAHAYDKEQAKRTSVHYTPRGIAEYMVDEALFDLVEGVGYKARVLDPAVGAGVFLVAAYRALVRLHWEATGKRPTRRTLRSILNNQLAGMDVNPSALRLAALALYLTALELDPKPSPLEELRFDKLEGKVLFDVRDGGRGETIGSLADAASRAHRGKYDLVIGNPPWTEWEGTKLKKEVRAVTESVRAIIDARLGEERARTYEMSGCWPDVPFLWHATTWAKPGGRIALAMDARLLLGQEKTARDRRMVLEGIHVTGILNGAALRETEVWPSMRAKFCLLFARNEEPPAGAAFNFLSPVEERPLNARGILRLDASMATPVRARDAVEKPWLLKALSRGTQQDVAIVERITSRGFPTLAEYWGGLHLKHGQGFKILGHGLHDAEALVGLPMLGRPPLRSDAAGSWTGAARIDTSLLPRFSYPQVHRPRDRRIYKGPLVLVPKAPPTDTRYGRAGLCEVDIAFNESFTGFSCKGHANARSLSQYLVVLFSSDLPVYLALMRSGEFAAERDVFQVRDLEGLPIPPFESLKAAERQELDAIARPLLDDEPDWERLHTFVYALYGIGSLAAQAIDDTLAVASPFGPNRRRAERAPDETERRAFQQALEVELNGTLARVGCAVVVAYVPGLPATPWQIVQVRQRGAGAPAVEANADLLRDVVKVADEEGSTRIVLPDEKRCLVTVAMLAQFRYWTRTRARMLAHDLLREHEGALTGQR